MGGDQEHTITVDEDGDLSLGDPSGYVVKDHRGNDARIYRPKSMSDAEARAVLTAPRMRPLPDGAPGDSVPSRWSEEGVICEGRCVPGGWEWRFGGEGYDWNKISQCTYHGFVEARPPQPPATERVRLDQIVGRVLAGETEKVTGYSGGDAGVMWWSVLSAAPGQAFPLPLDADGMVEVIAP